MKYLLRLFLIFAIFTSFGNSAFAATKFRPSEKAEKWADKQIKKMSLDEKIGQLVHIGINARFMNQDSPEFITLKRQVTENKIGGIVVFVGGVYETVHLINRMQKSAKIPLLISADFETGVGMRFYEAENLPWNMAIAATGNPEYARKLGAITAREARALGVQQVFAPVVDVNNNPDNPVINVRSFGENPQDVARFGNAFAEGLQSGNVLATAKHFPGHGDTAIDSHRGLPVIDFSRERLEKTEFLPFRRLIENGVGSVMISHISMPQLDDEKAAPLEYSIKAEYTEKEIITEGATVPATLSEKIVTGILKKDMNFDGLIVTDALDMSGLTIYFDQGEAAVRAILAGNDVLLKPANAQAVISGIREAVANKRISENRINESVKKILAWKYQLGLVDRKITNLDEIDKIVSNQETRNLSDEIARNAITLVKNEEGVLPLKVKQKAVVLCITNGNDISFIGNALISSLRKNGLDVERIAIDERSTNGEINRVTEKAEQADVVIAGLFGRVRSGAKNSVGLPEAGERVLRQILQTDRKTISVAFGNPYLIRNFPEMKNYIVAYGDTTSLQKAAADAITGRINFAGKLPISLNENYKIGTNWSLKMR